MEIKYKNYLAKEVDGKFDLIQKRKVVAEKDSQSHKKGDKYKVETIIAYSISFQRLLEKLVQLELAKKDRMTL